MIAGRTLVAGLGNIFFGDDAFGVETVHRLMQQNLPPNVRVLDIGTRSYDLAYALMDGYERIILVDAIQRGERPGTVSLIDLGLAPFEPEQEAIMNAHSLHPAAVVQMVRSMDIQPETLYLVGCEPMMADFNEDGTLGLSECVRSSIPKALTIIESIIYNTVGQEQITEVSMAAAERR